MNTSTIIVVLVVIVAVCVLGGAVWWLVGRGRNTTTTTPRVAEPVIASPDPTLPADSNVPAAVPESQPKPELMTPAGSELEVLPIEETIADDAASQLKKEPDMPEETILTTPATDPAAAVYDSPEDVVAAEPLVEDPEPEFDLSPSLRMVETSPPSHRGELL